MTARFPAPFRRREALPNRQKCKKERTPEAPDISSPALLPFFCFLMIRRSETFGVSDRQNMPVPFSSDVSKAVFPQNELCSREPLKRPPAFSKALFCLILPFFSVPVKVEGLCISSFCRTPPAYSDFSAKFGKIFEETAAGVEKYTKMVYIKPVLGKYFPCRSKIFRQDGSGKDEI